MNVVLVGATGVLGRALVPRLAEHRLRLLVRTPAAAQRLFGSTIEAVACDLLAPDAAERLPDVLAGADVVIHAATAIPKEGSPPEAWAANARIRAEGTAHLLAATLAVGAAAYVQQSICFAYPDLGDQWIDETTPLNTSRANLIDMESQVRAIPADRLRWTILRGGIFVGPGTFQDDTIARLRAGTEAIPGDGSAYMPYVHVEDVAAAFAAAVERAPAGSIFNVADTPIQQGEYLTRLAATVGAPPPAAAPDAPCPPTQRVSSAAARAGLGWTPTRGIWP